MLMIWPRLVIDRHLLAAISLAGFSLFYQNVSPVGIRQLLLSQAKCISMCAGSSKTRVKVRFERAICYTTLKLLVL